MVSDRMRDEPVRGWSTRPRKKIGFRERKNRVRETRGPKSPEMGGGRSRLRSRVGYAVFLMVFTAVVLVITNSFYAVRFHRVFVGGDSTWPDKSWRFHETIGFEMTPSFSAPMNDGSFYVKSHRLGYRIPREADQSSFEPGGILAIGCSFTYGDEVEAEQTFAQLVGQGLGLPVYNFGGASYSYASIILQLEVLSRTGVLDELKPSIILLGTEDWLVDRSLSPLYPTTGLPYGYPYLRKRDGALEVVNSPDSYSIDHFFALREEYYPDGVVDSRLTMRRFWLMFFHTPRVFAARIHQRFSVRRSAESISNAELYRFVLEQVSSYAERHGSRLVVLWMPLHQQAMMDPALHEAVRAQHLLVDGGEAVDRYNVPLREFVQRHPQPSAHRAYADHVLAAVRSDEPER